jgi:hypothetical protein
MDTWTMGQFGPTTKLYAAELVRSDGYIVAVVLEPEAREHDWEHEDAFRDVVRARAAELYPSDYIADPDEQDYGQTISLVWDPARDQTEEELLCEFGTPEHAK